MLEIEEIEQRAGSVKAAHLLLGVSQNRWYTYRRGDVSLPLYIKHSIDAHLRLSDREFKRVLTERVTPTGSL